MEQFKEIQDILGANKSDLALSFKHSSQINALKILGNDKAELALLFNKDYQLITLIRSEEARAETMFASHYYFHFYMQKFTSPMTDFPLNNLRQIDAIKILEGDNAKLALSFVEYSQIEALKILGNDAAKSALLFVKNSQVKALEILGNNAIEAALQFNYLSQVEALKILGNNAIDLALRFSYSPQVNALKILGNDAMDLALQFSYSSQVNVLEILGNDATDLALQFDYLPLTTLFKYLSPVMPLNLDQSADNLENVNHPALFYGHPYLISSTLAIFMLTTGYYLYFPPETKDALVSKAVHILFNNAINVEGDHRYLNDIATNVANYIESQDLNLQSHSLILKNIIKITMSYMAIEKLAEITYNHYSDLFSYFTTDEKFISTETELIAPDNNGNNGEL